jgi:hypothetical protein
MTPDGPKNGFLLRAKTMASDSENHSRSEYERLERVLLENMRRKVREMRDLLDQVNDHWT